MTPRKGNADVVDNGEGKVLPAPEKIARLLALIVIKEMETDDAAMKLLGVGFGPREISALLGVGDNYVHVVKNRRKVGRAKKVRKR